MADSSPETTEVETQVTTPVETTQTTDVSPESSTAEKPAGSMLDAVKAAIAPKEESPSSESTDEAAKAAADDSKKELDDAEELSADELKAVGQKVQRRFKYLSDKVKAKDGEVESLRPKAAEFDKIDTFIKQAGLSNDEVGEVLQIGALLKSDIPKAYERIAPIWNALQSYMGNVLPPDLKQQVDQGYITEVHARELVKARNGEATARRQAETLTARQQADQQQREIMEATGKTVSAIETWEAAKAAKDPDWHEKQAEVSELVELAIRKKTDELKRPWFPTSDEAIKLSEDALKTVEKRMKRFAPKPAEIKTVTGGASTRSTAAPKTMLEVVRMAAGAA